MNTRTSNRRRIEHSARATLAAGALALALCWSGAASAQADTVTFAKGSLIIPMNASFQTSCGAISAYGLIWRILQSNQAGHYNAAHPVTVYWIVNPAKTSPNRCVPTNKTTAPTPNSPANTTPNHWDDPWWNDGCDLRIQSLNRMPVVPVDYGSPPPPGGFYPVSPLRLLGTRGIARPAFSAQTVDDSGRGRARFTTVQYLGGPFVIDAADAANVLGFLRRGDSRVSRAELAPFTTPCSCAGTSPSTSCHYVAMHQSTIQFTATVGRRMSAVPPKIALLDAGAGVKYCVDGNPCTGARVLDTYLQNAGLYHVDNTAHTSAGGCPAGSHSDCDLNGSVPGPTGTKYPGLIYDQFSAYTDLISTASDPHGLLNRSDARGQPIYRVFWTPHWETDSVNDFATGDTIEGPEILSASPDTGPVYSTYVPNGDGAATQRENALNNLAHFLDRTGTGLMAECASIPSYESDPRRDLDNYSQRTRFLFNEGITTNEIFAPFDGRNCTDPGAARGGDCMLYPNPANPFSQIGDWRFLAEIGHTQSFGGRAPGAYRPGVTRLGVTWTNYVPGDFPANVTRDEQNGWDIFALGFKDNDPRKASIIYIAGHEYTTSTVGNRFVLNTLMNLGYEPIGSERALTAPIAYDDPNGSDAAGNRAIAISATYSAVTGHPPGADTFNPATGSRWYFPITPGHLGAHSIIGGSALAAGENELGAAVLWEASARLPLPRDRNLFTYFGGQFLEGSSLRPFLPPGARAPHDVRQAAWIPERVSGTALPSYLSSPAPHPSCVDVMRYGRTPADAFGMVPGADGVCDLQQALEYTPIDPGPDFGVATRAANLAALQADLPDAQQLLQVVRGHCFATTTRLDGSGSPILEPTDAQCNKPTDDNRASLGGFVHSTPALVPPSPRIPDRGAPRPTVVYAGGYDGQLHAFYVSGGVAPSGGGGYAGPLDALSFPNPDASAPRPGGGSVFATDWSASFRAGNAPLPGTELWSFIPASQLPLLRTNNARVDSSPVVMDAFVDLTGSGVRRWHTLLVVSIGRTGRELLALDVTNPLKPVLLWDVVGSVYPTTATFPPYFPGVLADSHAPAGLGGALGWLEPGALFRLPPAADPGRIDTGLYDYTALGGSSGLSMGQIRAGLEPVYAVFVASNTSGLGGDSKGIAVFAIDAATGQKLWQWEQPYASAWSDNTVPPVATLVSDTDGARRVFMGDMEGRVWELDAATGQNVNHANNIPSICLTPPCNYAAFDTGSTAATPRPITTNIAIAKVPAVTSAGSALASFPGATVLAFGTAGADWVPSTVAGQFHVLLADERLRVPFRTGGQHLDGSSWPQPQAQAFAQAHGALQEAGTAFPLTFAPGEHLYGTVTVSGRTVFFATARGPVGDLMTLSARTQGATYSLDLGASPLDAPAGQLPALGLANYGGVTVYHRASGGSSRDHVIGLEVNRITNTILDNPGESGAASPDPSLRPDGRGGILYQLKAWVQRLFD